MHSEWQRQITATDKNCVSSRLICLSFLKHQIIIIIAREVHTTSRLNGIKLVEICRMRIIIMYFKETQQVHGEHSTEFYERRSMTRIMVCGRNSMQLNRFLLSVRIRATAPVKYLRFLAFVIFFFFFSPLFIFIFEIDFVIRKIFYFIYIRVTSEPHTRCKWISGKFSNKIRKGHSMKRQ